jgi:FkbH-like protein
MTSANITRNPLKVYLIADFNLDTLGNYLANSESSLQLTVSSAPFGQVIPALLQAHEAPPADFAVVWTSPETMVPSFAESLNYATIDEDRLLAEVHEFAECLRKAQKHYRAIFVMSWTLPYYRRGNGILNLKGQGARKLLLKMNLKLAEELEDSGSIYLLDAQRWTDAVGKNSYSPKLWYMTKTRFHADVLRRAASDINAAISGVLGDCKKLVIVDLDNTLWGGVVGDLGWQNLKLGGHDYLGEAFIDFQKALKGLRNRGVLLAIASKNEESVALEALAKHPEMVLRPEDFAAWRINWNDKAANIVELAAQLNLGLQSAVFIDDNPVERARVREALPEVQVPDWPDDKTLFASRLLELDCFDSAYATVEDASRSQFYADEKQRGSYRKTVNSAEEWLLSLQTEVSVEELSDVNRIRVIQLLNKTNQMNLTTRRVSEQELEDWLQQHNRKLWAFRVKDKFGDSGLTGVLSVEMQSGIARIVDFVLSCRVIGRRVEDAMVAFAAEYCAAAGLEELHANYLPTAKNKPCLSFWMSSGFSYDEEENRFGWLLSKPYPFPKGVGIRRPQTGGTSQSQQRVSRESEGVVLPVFTNSD